MVGSERQLKEAQTITHLGAYTSCPETGKSFVPTSVYSTAFIYYTVKSSLKTITQHASGSTFKEISGSVLKTVKVVLPKSYVVEQFTNSVEPIFKRQDFLEQENQQLTQLRDWLLPLLMNGQVTVN